MKKLGLNVGIKDLSLTKYFLVIFMICMYSIKESRYGNKNIIKDIYFWLDVSRKSQKGGRDEKY